MALTINYVLDPATASATLSRVIDKTMNIGDVPDDIVPLDVAQTSYTYDDGVDGKTYGFLITVTDAAGKVDYGDPFNFVYKDDTGPGNEQVVRRGYYDFGVYEFLTVEEFGAHPDDLRNQLFNNGFPLMPLGYTNGTTGWYKCLVDGNVIFIPKNYHIGYEITNYYWNPARLKEGAFISDGVDSTLTFDNCPELTINGRRYRWRGMKHWIGNPPDLNVPLKLTLGKQYERISEVDLYFALSINDKMGYDPLLKGLTAEGQTLPPFNAGDSNIFNGRSADTGINLMGGRWWPTESGGGGGPGMWKTGIWTDLTATQYVGKLVPVLELLP